MAATTASDQREREDPASDMPRWLLGLLPLLLVGALLGAFAALGGPGLAERTGAPIEQLVVERTVLQPGTIELALRNDGPDAVRIAQVAVNDAFTTFKGADDAIGRLGTARVTINHPWIEGEAYEVKLLTSSGTTIAHAIEAAAATPDADVSFYALMALLGLYVGVIPVALGMLWLPWMRRVSPPVMRVVMAATVGILAVLGIEALLEGQQLGREGAQALGGSALVYLGAVVTYLALTGVGAWLSERRAHARAAGASGGRLAFLVAFGIGMHNLGEGLAIGSAYATGALALGTALVAGFALHNTTEGLAIVAPIAHERPRLTRLLGLGLIAGAPAILGTWIGASAFNASLASFLFGAGAGAIAQVIVQLAPTMRQSGRATLSAPVVGGLLGGMALMFLTGLAT